MLRLLMPAAAGFFLISSAAYAGGLYDRNEGSFKDAPPVYSPATWAGFYIGGHLGGAFGGGGAGDVSADFFNATGTFDDTNLNNFAISDDGGVEDSLIAGVHVGYNWQQPGSALVFGIEGDVSFGDEIDYLASLRARLGYAMDSVLIYATAGVAIAEFGDNSLNVAYTGNNIDPNLGPGDITLDSKKSDDGDDVAFVLGGGAEVKVSSSWSLGLEALYYMFDDKSSSVVFKDDDLIDDEFATFSRKDETDLWTIRARLTYHVNPVEEPLK